MSKSKREQEDSFSFWPIILAFFIVFPLIFFLKKKPRKNIEGLQIEKEEVVDLNDRQKRILKLLSSKGEVTVEELMKTIKDVTERTLRRDMKRLEQLGLSEKQGSTKGSKYIYTK